MAPNKRWINILDRPDPHYRAGVDAFLNFAFKEEEDQIRCPCNGCRNIYVKTRSEVKFHLFKYGILRSYKFWHNHGETGFGDNSEDNSESVTPMTTNDSMKDMLHDACGFVGMDTEPSDIFDIDGNEDINNEHVPNAEAAKFYRLLKDAK